METEELIRKCKAITLEEDKTSRVAMGEIMKGKGKKLVAGSLLGRVLHPRGVSREGLKSALQQVWRTAEGFRVESLGSKTFLFKFASEADKRRILSGGPWHFECALIVLKEPSGIGEITKQAFTHSAFWVQLHNLPVGCMEQETVRMLGEAIGTIEEIDADEEGECIGKYALVRISIDITQPLKKIIYVEQEGEEDIPIPVAYERLPDFRFYCGLMGHPYKKCDKYKGQARDKLAYGVWMQAVQLYGRSKVNRSNEKGPNATGTSANQSAKTGHKEQRGNSPAKHQQGSQWNRVNVTRTEPSSNKEDEHVAIIQKGTEKEVGEDQLMPSSLESREQLQGCNKIFVTADNEEQLREQSGEAGKADGKWRESEKSTRDRNLAIVGLEQKRKAQDSREEEEGGDNGPQAVCIKPKEKSWKRQARIKREASGTKSETYLCKRLRQDNSSSSPNQKRIRTASLGQPTQKQIHSSATKPQPAWESMSAKEMKMPTPTIPDTTAGAGGQPRRQP